MDRKIIYNKLANLNNSDKKNFSNFIVDKLNNKKKENINNINIDKKIKTSQYKNAESIFIYKALDNEVNLDKLIDISLEYGKTVAVPITNENMEMVKIDKNTEFELKKFNVREPKSGEIIQDVDLAIIPIVAFDKNCNRTGHGKGYYDKFLAKHNCLKMGVAFSIQEINNCIVKITDIPMDMIII